MTMNRSIEGFTRLGDHDLADRQAGIQAEFQKRHPGMDDVPLRGRLPQAVGVRNQEATPSPLSAETQKLVEHMRSDGYAVYETTGRTPASLKSDGMRYWFLNDKLADLTAPPALLAFKKNSSEFFLPESQNVIHSEQVKLLLEEQSEVDKRYPNAGLVVREGKLPEWTEIALRHFKTTGVRIFGRDYGYNLTWTDTYESEKPGASRAYFGSWGEANGAVASLWNSGHVHPHLRLASLVEISRK